MRASRWAQALVLAALAIAALTSPACRCGDDVAAADPCGDCAETQYCCHAEGACRALPPPMCDPAPPCGPAYWVPDAEAAVVDEQRCIALPVPCGCAALSPGRQGEHSSLAIAAGGAAGGDGVPVVAGYEAGFGDLIYGEAALADAGWQVTWQIVDGAPAGPQVAAADGWRGGVELAGDDVGAFTAIAVGADGAVHVAYHDLTHGALKLATRAPGGADWTIEVVDDGAGGRAGLYNSLVLDADGAPLIAHLVPAVREEEGTVRAELRLMRRAGEAWSAEVIDAAGVPCGGLCGDGEVCLADGFRCVAEADGCPDCGDGACLDAGDGPACAPALFAPTAHDLPEGTGLFATLAWIPGGEDGDVLACAYHDRTAGDLRLALRGAEAWEARTVEGDDAGDVGQHLDFAVGPDGALHLVYVEAVADDLWYRRLDAATLATQAHERVDDGLRDDGLHVVGADAAVGFSGDGALRVLYQDQTTADLVRATRGEDGTWAHETLAGGAPGYGFYTDAARLGAGLIASTYVVDPATPPLGRLELLEVP